MTNDDQEQRQAAIVERLKEAAAVANRNHAIHLRAFHNLMELNQEAWAQVPPQLQEHILWAGFQLGLAWESVKDTYRK